MPQAVKTLIVGPSSASTAKCPPASCTSWEVAIRTGASNGFGSYIQ